MVMVFFVLVLFLCVGLEKAKLLAVHGRTQKMRWGLTKVFYCKAKSRPPNNIKS